MLPLKFIACVVVASLAAAGCSRLTFIKPKMERGEYTQVAPEYNIRRDAAGQQRIAAMDRIALAGQLLRNGKLDEAEEQTNAALKADPKSTDSYTLLAVIAEQRGQASLAGTHYAKAMAMAPTRGAVLSNYGAWLCRNGRPAESLELFDRALSDPAYATPAAALSNSGSCALSAGQDGRAENYLRRALQLDANDAVALAAMAKLAYKTGHYMDARAYSERRLGAAQASPEVLQLASQIEQKLDDNVAAARYVQRIRAEFPQSRAAASGDVSQP